MELAPVQRGMLDGYLDGFLPLVGDKRTEALSRSTVQGIIAGESLACARIAASSPGLSTGKHGEQRVRRMAKGESTKRSNLGARDLVERLQARGVEQLRDEAEVWAVVDPSDLRKPYAREMPDLMRVRKLASEGEGTVPGYRTLNVLGIGRGGKRGILYHRLFTSKEDDFLSESKEIRDAFDAVGNALKDKQGSVTYICDTQFDDVAVWGVIWETDHPVTNEQEGLRGFRMYRERWAIEDCFKFTKEVLGWEDVQLMDLEGIRTLVTLGWVAAGFLYELGVSLDWPEVRLLARLGGWNQREDRPPGKTILTRGLQQLLNNLVVEAILQDEIARYGQLPPRIAAMLGRPSKPSS